MLTEKLGSLRNESQSRTAVSTASPCLPLRSLFSSCAKVPVNTTLPIITLLPIALLSASAQDCHYTDACNFHIKSVRKFCMPTPKSPLLLLLISSAGASRGLLRLHWVRVGVVRTFFLSSVISLFFSLSLGDGPI